MIHPRSLIVASGIMSTTACSSALGVQLQFRYSSRVAAIGDDLMLINRSLLWYTIFTTAGMIDSDSQNRVVM
jgi:hypothetical protein